MDVNIEPRPGALGSACASSLSCLHFLLRSELGDRCCLCGELSYSEVLRGSFEASTCGRRAWAEQVLTKHSPRGLTTRLCLGDLSKHGCGSVSRALSPASPGNGAGCFQRYFSSCRAVSLYKSGLFLLPGTPTPLHDGVVHSEVPQPPSHGGTGDSQQNPGQPGPETTL